MSAMTLTPSSDAERAVLVYHAKEALGDDTTATPLAGLGLDAYRVARRRLVDAGELVRTPAGRYVPTKLAQENST